MKYRELTEEKKEELNSFLHDQESKQNQNGRVLFESVSKSVLLANTGGVAILSSLIVSGIGDSAGEFLRVSILFFVAGVSLFLVLRFSLAIKIGNSVGRLKQFHVNALQGKENVSDEEVRKKLAMLSSGLEGSKPIWSIGASIGLFLAGALTGCAGVFVAIG